jgi:hypothetical protein
MTMLVAFLLVAAVILFVLAGLKAGEPRFSLEWFAFACLAMVLAIRMWPG